MKRKLLAFFVILTFAVQILFSWDDHDQLTHYALQEEQWAQDAVIAESLETFLSKEKIQLVDVLQYFEKEASHILPYYASLPESLQFNPVLSGDALAESFLKALRVNPTYRFMLFYQPRAFEPRPQGKSDIDTSIIDVFNNRFQNSPFIGLAENEAIPVCDVIASASDEPDYGLDLGLFEDNKTQYGAQYGFKIQPWGNPALLYGSQAPLHMAFPWEDPIIKLAAPWTQQSLNAYRVLQFTTLARFAFQTGHPYWGYRFAGVALHYLQDLAQPYHARLFPGKSTLALLAMNMFGSQKQKDDAVVILSNRHLAFEDYVYDILADEESSELHQKAIKALSKSTKIIDYRNMYGYDVIAFQAYKAGNSLDRMIASLFPEHIVNDPGYDYGADKNRPWKELYGMVQQSKNTKELDAFVESQLELVGMYTRSYLNSIRLLQEVKPRNVPADSRSFIYVIIVLLAIAGITLIILRIIFTAKKKRHDS